MPLSKDEIYEHAVGALQKIHEIHGDDYRFPADLIWQHVPPGVVIPATAKSHQPRRLMMEGYLERTGAMTLAASPARQRAPTAEYRFGPRLVERKSSAAGAGTQGDMTVADGIVAIGEYMESSGYYISTAELANFFLAMTVSPVVILTGISGTGKSLLPRRFAESTGAVFQAIPVQPQWSDNSDLLGYVPTLTPDRYVPGAIVESLLAAQSDPDRLVIALLDEMNLAPVEHYFSDFLSVLETRSRRDGKIVTDPIPLEVPRVAEEAESPYERLRRAGIPSNLRVIGTANMDETTHAFSPKVLDRAFSIEFDDPDLTSLPSGGGDGKWVGPTLDFMARRVMQVSNPASIREALPESELLFRDVVALLAEIQEILAPVGAKIGYRTRDAILLYMHNWKVFGLSKLVSGYAALDYCILQKLLPKISGTGEVLGDRLELLAEWLENFQEKGGALESNELVGPLTRSSEKVNRMWQLVRNEGSARFWGA